MGRTMSARHDLPSASHDGASAFDVLSDVLRAVRLTGALLFLVDAATPWHSWAPRSDAFRRLVLPGCAHMVSYHVLTEGRCWAGLSNGEPCAVEAGDVLIVAHGEAYYLAAPVDAPPSYGPREALDFFRDMAAGVMPSAVAEGGSGAKTRFICGFLGCDREPFNPVLSALPPLTVVRGSRAGDRMAPLVEFAVRALREPRGAGQDGVLLRLAELMFVEVLRRHLDALPAARTGWLAGLRDPLVARALQRLHGAPAQAWTLESLADAIGASRTVLAERFAHVVGLPAMTYLTRWRMQLASRLLADGDAKVLAVASAVGYESEAAFSRAFKKAAGVAPALWRRRGA